MRRVLPLLAILFSTCLMQAQRPGQELGEKLESMRIAYMTEKLEITPGKAETFWPLFREYRSKLDKVDLHPEGGDPSSLSDDELEKMLLGSFDKLAEVSRLNKEYLPRFQEVLGRRDGMLVFVYEHEFKRFILRRSRDQQSERGGNRGGRQR